MTSRTCTRVGSTSVGRKGALARRPPVRWCRAVQCTTSHTVPSGKFHRWGKPTPRAVFYRSLFLCLSVLIGRHQVGASVPSGTSG